MIGEPARTLAWTVLATVTAGAAYAALVTRVTTFPNPFPDRIVLAGWIALALAGVSLPIALLGCLVRPLLVWARGSSGSLDPSPRCGCPWVHSWVAVVLALTVLHLLADHRMGEVFFRAERALYPHRWWIAGVLTGIFPAAALLFFGEVSARRSRPRGALLAHGAILLTGLALAVIPLNRPMESSAPVSLPPAGTLAQADAPVDPAPARALPTGIRVVLIGVDGAAWDVWTPMIQAGCMPFLGEMRARGVSAILESEAPFQSPVAWTTLATGVPCETHGIRSFLLTRLPGCRFVPVEAPDAHWLYPFFAMIELLHRAGIGHTTPITRDQVRVPYLWERVSTAGGSAVVLNAYASTPASPLRGAWIGDAFFREMLWLRFPPRLPLDQVQPRGVAEQVGPVLRDPLSVGATEVATWFPLDDADRRELALPPDDPRTAESPVFRLAWSIGVEENVHACARRLMETATPDLTFFVTALQDEINHWFVECRWPERFPVVDPERVRRHAGIVEAHHRSLDARIRRLADALPARTVLIIASDHGIRFGVRWPMLIHAHGPQGVFLAAGYPFRSGVAAPPLRLVDVAPTILYLLGIEVPPDLAGEVRTDLLEPEFVRDHPQAARTR